MSTLVGAHQDGRPLGLPATQQMRILRRQAHAAFDEIWKRGSVPGPTARRHRRRAYRWLARELNLTRDACHIGRFDARMCRRVIAVCRQRLQRKERVTA